LVAARNIKNRLEQLTERNREERLSRLREEVQAFWDSELEGHFLAEEKILEMFASHVGPQDEGIGRILQEHRQMEGWIRDGGEKELGQLSELLVSHIRYEEDSLFGRIEGVFGQEEFDKTIQILAEATPKVIHIPGPAL